MAGPEVEAGAVVVVAGEEAVPEEVQVQEPVEVVFVRVKI